MAEVPGVAAPADAQANGAAGGSAASSAADQVAEGLFTIMMMAVQQQMSNMQDSMDAF